MLLEQTRKRNPQLIEVVNNFHRTGKIRPDSYCLDVDQFIENAKMMIDTANREGIKLYFMLKQVARNPYLAKKLCDLGYAGAVVVDYKEAKIMMEHNIPIGNIGHLVQVPNSFLEEVILYRPEVITVYSLEKVSRIHELCKKNNLKQSILIRVVGHNDHLYSGQNAGIFLNELSDFISEVKKMDTITVEGVTSFPAILYQENKKQFETTENMNTILEAKKILENLGISISQVNTPSATCCRTIPLLKKNGGTHGEPGHGLSGTTPAHANLDLDEKPCVIYLSEISHHFQGKSYCYGGGHYRRSHLKSALVQNNLVHVYPPDVESIDYHFWLDGIHPIGEAVVMAFRFQMFVTRSDLVLIEGIKSGSPKIIGVYDSLGKELDL